MADTKITALTALTAADPANDVLPIVDVSDTTMAASGTTKKISVNNILGASGTATLASATITGDLTVDTSTLKVDSANNRVGIGTASPAVTLDISDPSSVIRATSSTGTNTSFAAFANTGGAVRVGAENSAGGGLFTGSSAYSAVLGTTGAYSAHIGTNSTIRYSIASDGVATWSNVGGVAGTAMTLNSTGLGVGGSPVTSHLITSQGPIAIGGTGSGTRTSYISNTNACSIYYTDGGGSGYFADFGNLIIQPRTSAARNVVIATSSAAGTPVERLIVDPNGNVGIGVTPKTWSTGSTVEVGSYFLKLSGSGTYGAVVLNNAYYNGGWKFAEANWANMYQTLGGVHSWHTSTASGTATGNPITFTQAMTLENTGSLVLGAAAVATTATDGFLYIPGCAGTPTGTPTAKTGRVPLVVDTTNSKLYFYSGGAWVAAN